MMPKAAVVGVDPHAEEQQCPWTALAALDQPDRSALRLGDEPRAAVAVRRLAGVSVPLSLWLSARLLERLAEGIGRIGDGAQSQVAQHQAVLGADAADADGRS